MLLSVILPCRNEAGCVGLWESELFPSLDSLDVAYEVIAVDDGSVDDTAAALRGLAQKHPGLRIVSHQKNRGLGAALRTGFAASSGEWIATLDADLTFHPQQIRDLLKRQKTTGTDLVAGSPFLSKPGHAQIPWSRSGPSRCINAFYRRLCGPQLTAYTPIFRLYRASILRSLPLSSDGFEINAEIAALFLAAGKTVAEVPAVLTARTQGTSKLSRWRELRRHAGLAWRLWTRAS